MPRPLSRWRLCARISRMLQTENGSTQPHLVRAEMDICGLKADTAKISNNPNWLTLLSLQIQSSGYANAPVFGAEQMFAPPLLLSGQPSQVRLCLLTTGGSRVNGAAKQQSTLVQMCKLDRSSFVPLYRQIKDWLLERMAVGELLDGDALPSELQIAEGCGVSRMTARQALSELRMEGYVTREKGRGTFVARSAS
jgi:hypothetical protein